MKRYSYLLMLSLALIASSCTKKVADQNTTDATQQEDELVVAEVAPIIPTVSSEEQEIYKKAITDAARPKMEELVGETFFAGFKARKQGFQSTEKVELDTITLGAFKCKYHDPEGIKKDEELTDIWCHFYSNYVFKDTAESDRVYKELIKVRIDEGGEPAFDPALVFRSAIDNAFVTRNPLENTAHKDHFENLKEGRLAIGMPEEFLRVCWGNPKHIVDFEISETGRRETFVYRDFFVILKDRVVTSVNRFNDAKPIDPTAGL